MLRFPERLLRQVATALVFSAIANSLNAQVPNDQPTPISGARDFLGVVYPELAGRDFFLSFSLMQGLDGSWRRLYKIDFDIMRYHPASSIMVNPSTDAKTGKRLSPPKNTILKGDILFDSKGWLHAFEAVGDAAQTKQYDSLVELVDAHPKWSDADAVQALKQAGARFGPAEKVAFLRTFQLEKFEHFMGKLERKSAEFEPLPKNHSEGNTALGSCVWVVTVDRILPDGKRIPYVLRFEPFEGKLTSVHKQGELVGVLQEDD
ncbi:MAG: hypothetical protein JSS69_18300 [Acidobacteria bacterium]|nr:hypothetical protein [Acidobacteriota bacterium]